MFKNRFLLIFARIKPSFANIDFSFIKYILSVFALVGVCIFFGIRIVFTLEEGYNIDKKLELIQAQVKKLEEENDFLKKQKDFIMSNYALELEYRSLGYAKENEEIFFVNLNQDYNQSNINDSKKEIAEQEQNNKQKDNWKDWLLLLFK